MPERTWGDVVARGSLQMWKHYFAPESRIHGIDIIASRKRHEQTGVRIFIGDSADAAFLASVIEQTGPLDIVVDDGGHTARQQINAFEAIYPTMHHDGVYIVEDTHTSFWPEFIDTPDGKTFLQYAHERTLELHGWTAKREMHERFGIEPTRREGEIEVSEFCRTTGSIHFYDSVVVFEKARRAEPWHQDIGRWL